MNEKFFIRLVLFLPFFLGGCWSGPGTGPTRGTPADTLYRIETALNAGAPGDYLATLAADYEFTAHTGAGTETWGAYEDYALLVALFGGAADYECTFGWRSVPDPPAGVSSYSARVDMTFRVMLMSNIGYSAEGSGKLTFVLDPAANSWLVAAWDDDRTGEETTLTGYEPLSWGEIKLLFRKE